MVRRLQDLREKVFAWYYPLIAGISEHAGQDATRKDVFGRASGRTLEIGAGSGLNLPHLTGVSGSLVVSEPSAAMMATMRRQGGAGSSRFVPRTLVRADAVTLPFSSDSFDTVTAAFVLCTVPDPASALGEIARVLRPGGVYLFFEHVRAPDGSLLGVLQDLVAAPHRAVAAGCSPNCRTEDVLRQSPLRIQHLDRGHQPRSSPTVRPTIRGSAIAR